MPPRDDREFLCQVQVKAAARRSEDIGLNKAEAMETLAQRRDSWFLDLEKYVEGKLEYPYSRGFGGRRFRSTFSGRAFPTLYELSNSIIRFNIATKTSVDASELETHLFDALEFLEKLDNALHPHIKDRSSTSNSKFGRIEKFFNTDSHK
jgi:hypothetical protein